MISYKSFLVGLLVFVSSIGFAADGVGVGGFAGPCVA